MPPDQSATLAVAGRERFIGIALANGARDIRQSGAEQEGRHAFARIGDRMQEMQK